MNDRRAAIIALLVAPLLSAAQEQRRMFTRLQSIGSGPFEFPISGDFTVEREGGGTLFTTPNEARRYVVGFFRNIASNGSSAKHEQVAKLEVIIRRNWERFAAEEKGKVVQAFRRAEALSGVTVFSMATEFVVNGERQYYLQFAATDGPRFATLFAEGFGLSHDVMHELEPLIMRVQVADGG